MTKKMKGSIVAALVCLAAAGILLYQKYGHEPAAVQQPRDTTAVTKPASDTSAADRVVSPTAELQGMICDFEQELTKDAERTAVDAETLARWRAARKAGETRWASETKEPQYYASLDTSTLAVECFTGLRFAYEIRKFAWPSVGLNELKVFHNGFAELLERNDMWRGILAAYERLSLQIDPHTDPSEFIGASLTLDRMSTLYTLPPLKEQVKGREKLFLAAQVRALKAYKACLDAPYDPNVGLMFFREPCSVAEVALLLAKEIDPQRYAAMEPVITSVRFSEQQNRDELKEYIELVLKCFDGFPMDQEEHK